ncbi:hypothetical protein HKX48_006893 [Thoreauomyces humboldtii]|nr:hypothetical protein HKX48_006893 [Thoreauomyces humboldtii]
MPSKEEIPSQVSAAPTAPIARKRKIDGDVKAKPEEKTKTKKAKVKTDIHVEESSTKQDQQIIELVQRFAGQPDQWNNISKAYNEVNGATAQQLRNRWHHTLKKRVAAAIESSEPIFEEP